MTNSDERISEEIPRFKENRKLIPPIIISIRA